MSTPLPSPPQFLIVTADDFGFGVATSRGIVRAHRAGVVTSTSLVTVTGDHAAASVALLSEAPELEVGLHLLLSGPAHRPLVAGRSSGLVGREGGFHPLPTLMQRALRRKISPVAAFDEICAQADRAKSLLGRQPAYVDGHHHSHQLPVIREALVEVMRHGALPPLTRCTTEPPGVRHAVRFQRLRRLVMHRLGVAARRVFQLAGVQTSDACFGIIGPRQLREALPWAAYLPHLPRTGVVEWFVHPGEADATLAGRDSYIAPRVAEMEALIRLGDHVDWRRWSAVLTTRSSLLATSQIAQEI